MNTFPDRYFMPLDDALTRRDIGRQQRSSLPAHQQALAGMLEYRSPWIELIADPAGDGYFYDPTRSESRGSFFFNFAEDGWYTFFPAFRNYLAAVVEGIEEGVFVIGTRGVETSDFVKAEDIWLRYGASPER